MSVIGKQGWRGKQKLFARLFFLERISMSQIYSGQELKSFFAKDGLHQPQPNTCGGSQLLSLPLQT